jgi:hypothetical protein
MTALVDDLGIWVQLGTVNNGFDWHSFPVSSSTGNSTYRIGFQCANFPKIKTICYLRAVYQTAGSKIVDQKWVKLYPKIEKEIVEVPLSPLFQKQNLTRSIEIISKLKFNPIGQTVLDQPYTITLEEFLPYAETINAVNNIPQLQGIIDQELTQLRGELTTEIVNSINQSIMDKLNIIEVEYKTIIDTLKNL